ncbi:hypothetical protein IQ241_22870 [Romeria aff. gracilis LEGE 07310]|uniref:Uncharacterized protein n=1 Tax=Vasconcelosia minhoensis LEGE 07310 TaxID=915328 RepID=A0A8J7AJH3_9CYAN|nr:hypothetical protein [Romeria gracilis]MBE9080099.1 hypothetical protein [Romeria aff. gracilis LEGE 07310]
MLLNAVGAKSVDDLSDIFVTRAFTKSGTITKEETALKNRIANLWTRIGYIALMPNAGIETLTAEERKRLLDFEENLLAATALTDEFRGYGFKEDALLLGEMVQLGRVYASLNPQLKEKDKPADGGSTPPPPEKPDALLLTTSYSYLTEDYIAIESRLKQLGYNVITKNSADFTQADADGMELIVAADYSGPINLEFAGLEVPVVVLDNRKLDSLALAAASQTVVSSPVWIDAAGYLGPEGFIGELVLHKDDVPEQTVTLMNPTTLDLNLGVKSFLGGLSYSTIYANVQGDTYYDGQVPEARRVAFIGFVDSFAYLNDAGLQAFDAAVKWSANLKEPEEPVPTEPPSSQASGSFLSALWNAKLGDSTFEEGTNLLKENFSIFDKSKVIQNKSEGYRKTIDFTKDLLHYLSSAESNKNIINSISAVDSLVFWSNVYSFSRFDSDSTVFADDLSTFGSIWEEKNVIPLDDENFAYNPPSSVPPLGRNPDCGPGYTEVPLTKSRLVDIALSNRYGIDYPNRGAFQNAIGIRFEEIALESADVSSYTGRPLPSYTRDALTGGTFSGVIPDAIGISSFQAITPTGIQYFEYPDSVFVEVKQFEEDTTISFDTSRYQAFGYLDLAYNSPAHRAGHVPSVVFITTEGVSINNAYRVVAQNANIAIWQIIVHESCDQPGVLRNGQAIPWNELVYVSNRYTSYGITTSRLAVPF